MFVTKEAVRLAIDGVATGVACEGCPPLPDLLQRFADAGSRYYNICARSASMPRSSTRATCWPTPNWPARYRCRSGSATGAPRRSATDTSVRPLSAFGSATPSQRATSRPRRAPGVGCDGGGVCGEPPEPFLRFQSRLTVVGSLSRSCQSAAAESMTTTMGRSTGASAAHATAREPFAVVAAQSARVVVRRWYPNGSCRRVDTPIPWRAPTVVCLGEDSPTTS